MVTTRTNAGGHEVVDVVCPKCGVGGEVPTASVGTAVCGNSKHPDTVLVPADEAKKAKKAKTTHKAAKAKKSPAAKKAGSKKKEPAEVA